MFSDIESKQECSLSRMDPLSTNISAHPVISGSTATNHILEDVDLENHLQEVHVSKRTFDQTKVQSDVVSVLLLDSEQLRLAVPIQDLLVLSLCERHDHR
jgi:hypothetical protein